THGALRYVAKVAYNGTTPRNWVDQEKRPMTSRSGLAVHDGDRWLDPVPADAVGGNAGRALRAVSKIAGDRADARGVADAEQPPLRASARVDDQIARCR